MLERTATSLGTLLDTVREIARTWTPSRREAEEIWFRGQGTRKHQLVPTSPTIWMLDAGTLNQFSRGEDRVFSPGGALTLEYLPEGMLQSTSTRNEWPLAILPARFNSRIAAQQGMFTIHGRATGALDELVGGSSAAAATVNSSYQEARDTRRLAVYK